MSIPVRIIIELPDGSKKEYLPVAKSHLRELIIDLPLSVRSTNCLIAANMQTVSDLLVWRERDLLKLRNFGRRSLNEVRALLETFGEKLEH